MERNGIETWANQYEDGQKLHLLNNEILQNLLMRNPVLLEKVIQILMMKHDLKLSEVAQIRMTEREGGKTLDVLASDQKGRRYEISLICVGQVDDVSGLEQMQLYTAIWHRDCAGEHTRHYLLQIAENDLFGDDLPVYPVCGQRIRDEWSGWEVLYINGAYSGDSAIGCLMHDFRCTSVGDILIELVWDAVTCFKQSEDDDLLTGESFEEVSDFQTVA